MLRVAGGAAHLKPRMLRSELIKSLGVFRELVAGQALPILDTRERLGVTLLAVRLYQFM